MALTLFEDFEDGTVDDVYPGKAGDGWTVATSNLSTGLGPPRYRPSPDPTFFIQAPVGVGGDQALAFVGNSAYGLSVDHTISDGLGGYFYSNANGAGAGPSVSCGEVIVAWANLYGSSGGSLSVNRIANDLVITETYADGADSFSSEQTVAITDFLPVEGTFDTGLWIEVRWYRPDGWIVRDATTGATLASGAYPWTIPGLGLAWSLNLFPNDAGPLFPSGSSRVVVDDIYGYPGVDRAFPVVRQYPRDDEHGFSGGRRIYPPPRLGRIVGGQS